MVPRRAAGWWSETTRSSVNDDTENKNTMADINTIAEELGKLTVLEASELVKKLEEDWGVSAAAPAAAVAVAAPAEAEAAEEKTSFDVSLESAGGNKIQASAASCEDPLEKLGRHYAEFTLVATRFFPRLHSTNCVLCSCACARG